jgi:hypothetical protein
MTSSTEISASTAHALCRLARESSWIAKSPGGRVQAVACGDLFRVSMLLLDGSVPFLMTAEAVELGTHHEVFRVAARAPTERDREVTRPPFAPISDDAGLGLGVANRGPIDVYVLAECTEPADRMDAADSWIDVALYLEDRGGGGLLIDTRSDTYSTTAVPVSPLDLLLTTSNVEIQRCTTGLRRRALGQFSDGLG